MKLKFNAYKILLGQSHVILDWPKSSFGGFHNILRKNLNDLFLANPIAYVPSMAASAR